MAYFREQGSVLRGDSVGVCERFEVEISIDSNEPQEEITELIRLARQMCFTESALTKQVDLQYRHRLNGQTVGL